MDESSVETKIQEGTKKEVPEGPKYKETVSVRPGMEFRIGTKKECSAAVIGRNPKSTGVEVKSEIPPNAVGVTLEDTNNLNASRYQLMIGKNAEGRFYVDNLSDKFKINGENSFGDKFIIPESGRITFGSSVNHLNGLKCSWQLRDLPGRQIEVVKPEQGEGGNWEAVLRYSFFEKE